MKKLLLNGSWTLEIPGLSEPPVPAQVPGSVYNDLLCAGRMPDPFYRDNEMQALALMENDFYYTRTFSVPEDLFDCSELLLRCEGLDTVAEIRINGVTVGRADNMHRTWEYDVREFLKAGENEITVILYSPTRYIREAYAKSRADGSSDAMTGFPLLRKAHCMFGWDWGPRLPDAGIWRDIMIIGVEKARIRDVFVRQNHENGKVSCSFDTNLLPAGNEICASASGSGLRVEVTLTAPDGRAMKAEGESCLIEVDDPQLWWPAGFGGQPLYSACVRLMDGEKELDRWEKRIGLRTMTVRREKDQWGESFCHCVNGVDIFAMGSDYIPEDNLLPRVNPERTRRLLEDARAANMNTIRVWGGGYYPDDYFYDICDELGLMVWQDFMFACAVYNLTDEFDANIRAELTDNVRRIRSHPSLALWCGNNEMEEFVAFNNEWVSSKRQVADYIKMYEYVMPQVLKVEDPVTFYWPSSPSSGGSLDEPQDPTRGDVHYWDVWHGLKPFTDYRNYQFRYVSEFGFQSFPCMETIKSFTLPEDRNVFSYVMEKHQRNASANGRIAAYLSQTYLYPSTLDGFVYASQLLQAQAMQYGVEHWRRNRGCCMGTVIWQLNDCWPVVSWASIDYFGRWKALHYAAKRFFAPVLLSCEERGEVDQNPHINEFHPAPIECAAHLCVSNESLAAFSGEVVWSLRHADGTVVREGKQAVNVPAQTSLWLEDQVFPEASVTGDYFSFSLIRDQETLSTAVAFFCAPKHFDFADPQLSVRTEGEEIIVTAKALAKSVEIRSEDPDLLLSDNFFDMNPGEHRVRILRGKAERPAVRSVFDMA